MFFALLNDIRPLAVYTRSWQVIDGFTYVITIIRIIIAAGKQNSSMDLKACTVRRSAALSWFLEKCCVLTWRNKQCDFAQVFGPAVGWHCVVVSWCTTKKRTSVTWIWSHASRSVQLVHRFKLRNTYSAKLQGFQNRIGHIQKYFKKTGESPNCNGGMRLRKCRKVTQYPIWNMRTLLQTATLINNKAIPLNRLCESYSLILF